jgi:hypothetical protein
VQASVPGAAERVIVTWLNVSSLVSSVMGKFQIARWEIPGEKPAHGGLEVNGRRSLWLAFNP